MTEKKLNPWTVRYIRDKHHTLKDKGFTACMQIHANADYSAYEEHTNAKISDEELDDYIWSMLNGRHGVTVSKDVNAQNRHLNTALHLAVINADIPIMKLLMEKGGADVTIKK